MIAEQELTLTRHMELDLDSPIDQELIDVFCRVCFWLPRRDIICWMVEKIDREGLAVEIPEDWRDVTPTP